MKSPFALLAFFVFLASCPSLGYGEEVTVIVGPGLAYDPQFQEINVGDTVVWKWAYIKAWIGDRTRRIKALHTVTKSISYEDKCKWHDGPTKEALGLFTSGRQKSGHVFKHTFDKVETVTYHCDTTGRTELNCKKGMWGQINVVASGAKYQYPSKEYVTHKT